MREGSRRSTGLLFSILLSLLRFLSTLSPLMVLPVVRSAPHGRQHLSSFLSYSLQPPFFLISPSISYFFYPYLCGHSSFYRSPSIPPSSYYYIFIFLLFLLLLLPTMTLILRIDGPSVEDNFSHTSVATRKALRSVRRGKIGHTCAASRARCH